MYKALKDMPALPKIFLGCLLLLVIYALGHRRQPHPTAFEDSPDEPVSTQGDNRPAHRPAASHSTSEAEQAREYLAHFKQQQAQVQARAQECMAEMQQASNQMAAAAMNGQMMSGQPACEAQMPALTAQEAYLETVIYQLQTGDVHSTMQQITGVQVGQTSAPSYYRPSGPGNDGGIGAVENYDRQAIRGTSIYHEEDGTEHELQTEPYYFRNRETGQFVPSNQPDPPNDGQDYEPLSPQQ